jgi:GNAT superfamily N-acetyltransferase
LDAVSTSAATFQREPLTPEFELEIAPLLSAHWAEIAHYRDIPLDPDWDIYRAIEKSGQLRIYTARKDGALVGYGVYFVRRGVHYKESLQANQDILFLTPEQRGKTVGYRLIKYADEELRKEHVQVVYHHVKEKHDFSPLLERLGYVLVDKIYGRRLD